ncbi:MAG: hypothetical protein DRN40_04780, partial [Thermoplasmata archaeon]
MLNSDGTVRWGKYLQDWFLNKASLGRQGDIYVTGWKGPSWSCPEESGLFVFDYNGALKWKYTVKWEYNTSTGRPIKGFPISTPVEGPDGHIYIKAYAFYPNGSVKWIIPYNESTSGLYETFYNRIGPDGMLYSYHDEYNDLYLCCINSSNGNIVYRKYFENYSEDYIFGFSITDNNLLIVSSARYVLCLYPNGSVKWSYEGPQSSGPWYFSDVGIRNGGDIVVLGGNDTVASLFILNPDGQLINRFVIARAPSDPSEHISTNLVAIGGENTIYYSISNHTDHNWKSPTNLTAMYPNGTVKWTLSFPNYIEAAINSNGSIIVVDYDAVYSFGHTLPAPPQNISSQEGNSFINFSWDPPSDDGGYPITSYRVYRSSGNSSFSLLSTLPAPTTFFNDTALINGENYTYYVTAINRIGESPPSVKLTTSPFRYPDPPSNLTATPGNSFIILSWKPPPFNGGRPIISYNIYRGTSPGELSLLRPLPHSHLSYNDTQVKNGISYFYYITAVNMGGESPPSPIVSSHPYT